MKQSMKQRSLHSWLTFFWMLYAVLLLVTIAVCFLMLTTTGVSNASPVHPGTALFFGFILLVLLIMQALLAAATACFLQRSIFHPLSAIGKASQQIGQGDLTFSLPSSSTREMAEAIAAFNAMGQALRDSLAQQNRMEEERRFFISAIVHDLRTPLFSLRGYLEGIEQGIADTPEKIAHYLRICREKADALEHLITDLFTYTQLEYLELLPQREPTDIAALLTKSVEAIRPLAEQADITVTATGDTPPLLNVDKRLFARVIDNLLENALRHTPAQGVISIRWQWQGEHLHFTVADSGPGIAPNDLPRVFRPLFRGEASRNRRTGGAGLGLTIARQIMQVHGGELSVSNQEGGGAIFQGTLPQG
ncbi:signal transduction histidine kinase [Thermosporothrix hazakensis]|jgi:signal transduction histidine kinase|uniref:histidine kinase n=3 Tax=Thermosporothrix TaxID=768650 RepID=A0A326UBI0_THEHA|nr:HAMP domain-containing sensor histidine kinase [Thermosporothrix hazakensis]PZW32735.1 signal transduction histidine kinase [Thermosporothrix hazakensis]BBH87650.1 hypothetical protein KTC_24010 [Thermosporothrix sp. COM3]GCE50093.1 hypothetical protein KTH_49620 [Thermosporothrix hazakensis]